MALRKALAKRYSQLKPTRAKLQNQNLHRWVAKRYRQVEPARKSIIRPRSHLTMNKQLGSSWSRRQTVEHLARVGRKFELDQIQANSSQVGPNDTQLRRIVNLTRVGLSWKYRLARA